MGNKPSRARRIQLSAQRDAVLASQDLNPDALGGFKGKRTTTINSTPIFDASTGAPIRRRPTQVGVPTAALRRARSLDIKDERERVANRRKARVMPEPVREEPPRRRRRVSGGQGRPTAARR